MYPELNPRVPHMVDENKSRSRCSIPCHAIPYHPPMPTVVEWPPSPASSSPTPGPKCATEVGHLNVPLWSRTNNGQFACPTLVVSQQWQNFPPKNPTQSGTCEELASSKQAPRLKTPHKLGHSPFPFPSLSVLLKYCILPCGSRR